MNLITRRDIIWDRTFAAGPKHIREVVVKAGAPVELVDDARGGKTAFVNPAYFGKPGSILYHDAATHGCRVDPDNYYSDLSSVKSSAKTIRRAKQWTSAMGGAGVDIMSKLNAPSEYDMREYSKKMREIESAPLAERKENAAEWLRDLRDPALIAERIDWLLDGNYGYMEYRKSLQILSSPRMNRVAALSVMIAAVEWNTPQREAIAQWKKLSTSEQSALEKAIKDIIETQEEKWRGE